VVVTEEIVINSSVELFSQLELDQRLLRALAFLGYEQPTPIQAKSIPLLLQGGDLLAQAQTGTGKTAAFALPILSQLDLKLTQPQALVIVPTRELAIQVAEAFQSYARDMKGFHVTPIYGGQEYRIQLRSLKRGTHVIVGTPGRVMDHFRRGTLSSAELKTVVLDEADEMLKMGFIDDVQWILDQVKHDHQTALFSATIPSSIQKIAKNYLKDATDVRIAPSFNKVDLIEQSYIELHRSAKLDVLTRMLEVEELSAAIIFVRTKTMSAELAERLQARGYAASALNGDMSQSLREKVISKLKKGSLDIVVATDVAARGIDVERVSLVVNFDIPYDVESYIHRIGRTGRAGRKGRALLLVTQRERHLLKSIQREMNQSIERVNPPSRDEIIKKRDQKLADDITRVLNYPKKFDCYRSMLDSMVETSGNGYNDIAAALVHLLQKTNPLPKIEDIPPTNKKSSPRRGGRQRSSNGRAPGGRDSSGRGARKGRSSKSGSDTGSNKKFSSSRKSKDFGKSKPKSKPKSKNKK
jgi:ATP-dependent RNA helicase DeaD